MDCAAVKPKMEALVSGTLPEAERATAEQHISSCEGCRLELELVRAIGSQEKSGAAGQAEWTLDRIFGADQQEGRQPRAEASPGTLPPPRDSAPTAASPQESSSAFEMMDQVDHSNSAGVEGTQPPAGEDAAAQEPSTWAFEPADAKANLKPPDESLFFAHEALARRKDTNGRKGSNLRVILWGTGGVVGAILLAVSSWLALHMAPASDANNPPVPSQSGDAGAVAPDQPSVAPGQPSVAPDQPPAEQAPDEPEAPAAPEPTQEVPEVIAPDAVAVSPNRTGAGAPPAREPTSASTAPYRSPLPEPGTTPARTPAPAATKRATPPPSRQPSDAPRPVAAAGHRVVGESPKPSAPSPSAPSSGGSIEDDEATGGAAENPSAEPVPARESSRGASGTEGARPGPASQRSGSNAGASPRVGAAPSAKKVEEESAPAPPEIVGPIDRLHLATVAAAERADLTGLRRLRGTWKDFMSKMGVGPDRARARREYADCLWAIQSITGRRSDQKDALAAYREYLLSAPAGGADSRSVSHLRQLEDALAEKR